MVVKRVVSHLRKSFLRGFTNNSAPSIMMDITFDSPLGGHESLKVELQKVTRNNGKKLKYNVFHVNRKQLPLVLSRLKIACTRQTQGEWIQKGRHGEEFRVHCRIGKKGTYATAILRNEPHHKQKMQSDGPIFLCT